MLNDDNQRGRFHLETNDFLNIVSFWSSFDLIWWKGFSEATNINHIQCWILSDLYWDEVNGSIKNPAKIHQTTSLKNISFLQSLPSFTKKKKEPSTKPIIYISTRIFQGWWTRIFKKPCKESAFGSSSSHHRNEPRRVWNRSQESTRIPENLKATPSGIVSWLRSKSISQRRGISSNHGEAEKASESNAVNLKQIYNFELDSLTMSKPSIRNGQSNVLKTLKSISKWINWIETWQILAENDKDSQKQGNKLGLFSTILWRILVSIIHEDAAYKNRSSPQL